MLQTDMLQKVRQKLGVWYNSQSTRFPDGTKMRLVPTFASVLSANNKTKFASCLARQVALAARLASANTWEMTTNLLLDKKDPSTGKFFRDIMMALIPQSNPNAIAGLIPFLRDEGHTYFLKIFSAEAFQCHASSKWNPINMEVSMAEEAELRMMILISQTS